MKKTYTLDITKYLGWYRFLPLLKWFAIRKANEEEMLESIINDMKALDNQEYLEPWSTKDWLLKELSQGKESITWTVEKGGENNE